MKCTVTFDLTDELDRYRYADFLVMERNAIFWNRLYDEVFRPAIKYSVDDDTHKMFDTVWQDVAKYMEELRDE